MHTRYYLQLVLLKKQVTGTEQIVNTPLRIRLMTTSSVTKIRVRLTLTLACFISRSSEWWWRMERHGYQHSSWVSIASAAHVQLHNVKICRTVAGGGEKTAGCWTLLNHFQIRLPDTAAAASACTTAHCTLDASASCKNMQRNTRRLTGNALRLVTELRDLAK